ncbi:TRAPP II complex [Thamnocephalis sphaerospora]|uniref:TRAPP II complex n=1 Tax=Thamnocephalis sphaerospora TaxID=78915 RepID=A0A4P9XQD2_9FUNG|nr:TRAPP II complex [Thamnocephalis sphaerospora]|eukprot:RKP07490.1 TRAPP II complex [Thamnocephalis sphaerospora]
MSSEAAALYANSMAGASQPILNTGLLDQARIRVLLVPVLPRFTAPPSPTAPSAGYAAFQQYARQLARHNAVRLSDLELGTHASATSTATTAAGATGRWNEGKLRFNYVTDAARDYDYLEEFQPYRQVLAVIGIVYCPDYSDLADANKVFSAITDDFSRSVARRCIAFEPREDQRTADVDGITLVPRDGDLDTYLERFIGEFSQQLLSAFGIMIAAIERRAVISTPEYARPLTPNNTGPAGLSVNMSPQTSSSSSSYFRASSPNLAVANSNAAANEAKARKRTPGRAQKLIGDLLVLSGKLIEAVGAYVMAIDHSRNSGDYLWQASAMEGLCAAVGLLSLSDAPSVGLLPPLNVVTSSYGFTLDTAAPMVMTQTETLRKFVADVPSRYREVAVMYERANAWPLVYVEACLKMARFATTNEVGLAWRTEEASIWIARAWHYSGDALSINEQIAFATISAELLGEIGARRKQAFWLRRVVALIFPMLHRDAEHGLTPHEAVRQRVIACLGRICPAYGIEDYSLAPQGGAVSLVDEDSAALVDEFGWPMLQVDTLRECISTCEAINDCDRTVHFTMQLLRRRRDYLHRDDQARVAVSLHRMVASAISRGERRSFDGIFWNSGFLRHLEVCRQSDGRMPHSRKRIADGGADASGDPFIYNPYAKKGAEDAGEVILVVNEPAYFMATLWNPFAFDLELQDIRLSTSGVEFTAESASALIPAGSPLTVRLSGVPAESGKLLVHGCSVVVFGGVRQEFHVRPLVNEELQMMERRKAQISFKHRTKRSGLDAFGNAGTRSSTVVEGDAKIDVAPALDVPVIDKLALLRVRTTSLSHGAMMLFEGERSQMSITLQNIGHSPVDFLLPTFVENPTAPPPNSQRQTREDTYEQDMYAANTHAFVWPVNEEGGTRKTSTGELRVRIEPGAEHVLTIGLFGKRGCTGGTVQIDYGSEMSSTENIIYTRQITVPVLLSVRRTLELLNADVLAVRQRDTARSDADSMTMVNQMLDRLALDGGRPDHWCLLTLDVRNIWSVPFQLRFSIASAVSASEAEDECNGVAAEAVITLQPGSAKRMLLPVERQLLPADYADQPIPLVNKQFVVARGPKPSAKEEQLARHAFWYKEAMLGRILTTWECSPEKGGRFDLRAVRLTEPMLDVLRRDTIAFSTSVLDASDNEADSRKEADVGAEIKTAGGTFFCSVGRFVTVCIRIDNCGDKPSKLFFRAQPMLDYRNGQVEHNLSHHMIWSGQLQQAIPTIDAAASFKYELPVCFLRCGHYTMTYHAEDVHTNRVYQGGEIQFSVQPS